MDKKEFYPDVQIGRKSNGEVLYAREILDENERLKLEHKAAKDNLIFATGLYRVKVLDIQTENERLRKEVDHFKASAQGASAIGSTE